MEQEVLREECAQISIVLKAPGNAGEQERAIQMVKDALLLVKYMDADISCSIMAQTSGGTACQIDF